MRTIEWSAVMVVVILVMLMVPPLLNHPRMGWQAATTLVPQAMPLAVPSGIAFGIAFGISARPSNNLVKRTCSAPCCVGAKFHHFGVGPTCGQSSIPGHHLSRAQARVIKAPSRTTKGAQAK